MYVHIYLLQDMYKYVFKYGRNTSAHSMCSLSSWPITQTSSQSLHMHIYEHTSAYIYIYIYFYIYIYVYIYKYSRNTTPESVCSLLSWSITQFSSLLVCAYVCVYIYTYISISMYLYVSTSIHIYTCISNIYIHGHMNSKRNIP